MVNVEWVSAILTLRAWFWKKSHSLKYCRITWLGWRSHASVVSAHSFTYYADKDFWVVYLCSTRSLPLHGCISARVSPTCNLTVQCNYSSRSAYVKFPCKRFSLSTIATIRQWHLFLPHVMHADRKTDTQKRAKLDLGCLFDGFKHVLTKTYHFETWSKQVFLWK